MMFMCRLVKPLWGSGKKVIKGNVLFVLKGLLVCLREGSMEFNCPRRIDIGQHKVFDMVSIKIVK